MKKLDTNPLKNTDKNPFGGKNPHGMYVPLTDTELEVLERLALGGDFKVVIKDWGYVENFQLGKFDQNTWQGQPIVQFGDKNIHFFFLMNFSAPIVPQPNYFFDLEVWAKGRKLFGPIREPTTIAGNPIQIVAGMQLGMALDVALHDINPELVKTIKPGAIGLTSRHGNMNLTIQQQRMLKEMEENNRRVRAQSKQDAMKVTKKSKGEG